jgi:hypothetical protein
MRLAHHLALHPHEADGGEEKRGVRYDSIPLAGMVKQMVS